MQRAAPCASRCCTTTQPPRWRASAKRSSRYSARTCATVPSAVLDDPAHRRLHQLPAIAQCELDAQLLAVCLHRVDTDTQLLRDVARAHAIADELEYLQLPRAQITHAARHAAVRAHRQRHQPV